MFNHETVTAATPKEVLTALQKCKGQIWMSVSGSECQIIPATKKAAVDLITRLNSRTHAVTVDYTQDDLGLLILSINNFKTDETIKNFKL